MPYSERELKQTVDVLAAQQEPPLLMFDYDGTLAPFVIDRNQAFPYPEVKRLVEDIHTQTAARVVIVSGRAVDEISRLLNLSEAVEIWGCHGWERQTRDGKLHRGALPNRAAKIFEKLKVWSAQQGYVEQLELKPASMALHWRGLSQDRQRALEKEARQVTVELGADDALEVHGFDGGMEWRLPGWSKADAVQTLRQEVSTPMPMAYFGDDLTDEDAFKAMPEGGVSILVRKEFRSTAARLWLKPPEEFKTFLEKLFDTLHQRHALPCKGGAA